MRKCRDLIKEKMDETRQSCDFSFVGYFNVILSEYLTFRLMEESFVYLPSPIHPLKGQRFFFFFALYALQVATHVYTIHDIMS